MGWAEEGGLGSEGGGGGVKERGGMGWAEEGGWGSEGGVGGGGEGKRWDGKETPTKKFFPMPFSLEFLHVIRRAY